jgi:cyclophilin family peptidyl-prolyl cis-trans isomerase
MKNSTYKLKNRLIMELEYGNVVIETFPDIAPNHVGRVLELVGAGFYDGISFHRVIKDFVAQTGDPTGTGMGGSGKKLNAEFSDVPFTRGTIGMARAADINSADSQFFVCLADALFLTGQYTAWGRVIDGMEFVDQIHKGEPPVCPDVIVRMYIEGIKLKNAPGCEGNYNENVEHVSSMTITSKKEGV